MHQVGKWPIGLLSLNQVELGQNPSKPGKNGVKMKFGTEVQEYVRNRQKNRYRQEDGNTLKSIIMVDMVLFSIFYQGTDIYNDFKIEKSADSAKKSF